LVTPARFAFAIWGIIYTWEIAAMLFLALTPRYHVWNTMLWVTANIFQGLWAVLFAKERLGFSAVALFGIAVSLILLGNSLRGATGLDWWMLAAPVWLHAGWTSAASIVNMNLVLAAHGTSAAAQLAAAFASGFAALTVGLLVVASVAAAPETAPWEALPYAAALCWALHAIRSELIRPDLIKESSAYAEVGETGRVALQVGIGGTTLALGLGSIAVALVGSFASRPGSVTLQ